MTDTSIARPPLTIAILSSHGSVWCGLQTILESCATIPMVVHLHPWRTSDGFLAESRPDVVILDLETERDVILTLAQIRGSAPTSKIVILCNLQGQDRTREAFAAGVDGIKCYFTMTADIVREVIRFVDKRVPITGHLGYCSSMDAIDAGIDGLFYARLAAAPDHPMTVTFPEGEYLKGLVVIKS